MAKALKKAVPKGESIYAIPFEQIRPKLLSVFSEEYLNTLCVQTGIKTEQDRLNFRKGILHTVSRFIELKRINPVGLRPSDQNKLFNRYKKALLEAQQHFKDIQRYSSTSTKLGMAIRKVYEETKEPGMQAMFHPYCDGKGMAISLFEKFLGVLADSADDAKRQKPGYDKADYSSDFLMLWVAAMGKFWPKEAKVSFALGRRDAATKIYTSRSIQILRDIISKIDPSISEKQIENSMRKVIRKDLVNQPIAIFFLR